MKRGKKIFLCLLLVALTLLGITVLAIRKYGNILEGVPFSGTYLDRKGDPLRIFLTSDDKYRERRHLSDFPPEFIEGILLQEDRYFYAHSGINPGALIKAGWTTYVTKKRRVGASTITMQLARLKYHLYTRSVPGKLNQIIHTLFLELCFSKEEILEAYVNLVPCGKNIEGYPAAALYYFNTDIKALTLSQMLFLCVIPQDPSHRAPDGGVIPKELLDARETLFGAWLASHPGQADRFADMNTGINLVCRFPSKAPHFTEDLERSRRPPDYPIRTSIDADLQKVCEEHLARYIEQNGSFGVSNGSVMLVDYTTMEILASVGSAGYFNDAIQGQVNGTTAKRSPGSTLKPFIYALALEQGLVHSETMLKDTPVSFNEYTPDNYGSEFRGPIKTWQALVDSKNIPAVYLAQLLKTPDLYDFLKKTGIAGLRDRDYYGLSIVLGSAEITMTELVKLYAIIANHGNEKDLSPICNGTRTGEQRLTAASAFIVRKMLEQNPPPSETRPKTSMKVPIAYKTGTSIGFKDCWSVAIFDRYILCVWMGNFNGLGNTSFQGRTMAAPLLFSIADTIIAGIPEKDLLPQQERPETVTQVQVCEVSGALPGPDCPQTTAAWFIPGVSPINRCHIHRKIRVNTRTGYRTDDVVGPQVTEIVREFWPTDLLELFTKAGLPRLVPPPYPPAETRFINNRQGFRPDIISPLDNTHYVLRMTDDRYMNLILFASTDADASELFWFANNDFIGRSAIHEKLTWNPEPGEYTVSVTDSIGRSDSVRISVSIGE